MYENLTKLIPELQKEEYGEWIIDMDSKGTVEDPIHMPYVNYSKTVKELVRVIYDFVNEHKDYNLTGYQEILKKNGIDWESESIRKTDVSTADGQLVMALLVAVLRADRFVEGTLLDFYKNGLVLLWLQRLKEIDEVK